ncbi:Alpha/Beta hydrolase protein [Trichophaea hybrida]|nr:Alpha/Beta hydrolase protein [Trichophaea hybrida]
MSFPPPHVHPPTSTHTRTIILPHGRSSNGPDFTTDLFEGRNLARDFPSIRYSLQEMNEWFDIASLDDPEKEWEWQVNGLKESGGLVGEGGKVVLGGVSQGMATALIELLMGTGVDAFVGVNGGGEDKLKIPVFLGHGTDDAWVSVELGKTARDVLAGLGVEDEGHWLKEPEEFDDIVKFLETVVSKPAASTDM